LWRVKTYINRNFIGRLESPLRPAKIAYADSISCLNGGVLVKFSTSNNRTTDRPPWLRYHKRWLHRRALSANVYRHPWRHGCLVRAICPLDGDALCDGGGNRRRVRNWRRWRRKFTSGIRKEGAQKNVYGPCEYRRSENREKEGISCQSANVVEDITRNRLDWSGIRVT